MQAVYVIQHFMKKNILKIIFLFFVANSQAQLKLSTTLYGKGGGFIMASVNDEVPYLTSYDGTISIELTKKNNKIIFFESWISIEIINIPRNIKADLGSLEIPMRKNVTIEELNNFTEAEKKNIKPVYCHNQLLGYEHLNKLENPKLVFTCNNYKFELEKFVFNVKEQKVIINWKDLKPCIN